MSTARRKSRRRLAVPDILKQYWAGDPPPEREATPEDVDLIDGVYFFDENVPKRWPWPGKYWLPPHLDAWRAWVHPATD